MRRASRSSPHARRSRSLRWRGAGSTARCSTTATPWRILPSRGESSTRTIRGSSSSDRCGCHCRICLMIPFVAVYSWWASGIAGMIPSALAYIAGCVGLYRLARQWLSTAAAMVALIFFAINPNLLYLQTTAMTEPLFLCELIWTAVWLVDWRRTLDTDLASQQPIPMVHRPRARRRGLHALRRMDSRLPRMDVHRHHASPPRPTALPSILARQHSCRRGTSIWFVYNASVFGDWLDFARGPYSAKAIELRTATPGPGPPHPGWHDPWVSLLFLLKPPRWTPPQNVGQSWLVARVRLARSRLDLGAAPCISMGAASLAACSLLCVFHCVRLCAHFHASVVAALLVQHALRHGAACQPLRSVSASLRSSFSSAM